MAKTDPTAPVVTPEEIPGATISISVEDFMTALTQARTPKPLPSLTSKLAEIMGLMAHVPKEGFNKQQSYKFVRESDVAEKVSQLLAERHIFLTQTVLDDSREELYRTSSGNMMWLTTVHVQFQFIDGETGEVTAPVVFPGYGADTGDKGIYKAMTGAEKYFLMKTFLVSTGDDPEADDKVDKEAAAAGAATTTRVVRGSAAGAQRGGKSSVATEAQINQIAKVTRDLGLNATTVQPVILALHGKAPGTGETLRDFLSKLTFNEAAKLIAGMMDFKPENDAAVVADVLEAADEAVLPEIDEPETPSGGPDEK